MISREQSRRLTAVKTAAMIGVAELVNQLLNNKLTKTPVKLAPTALMTVLPTRGV
jgi:hypothetical protein